MVLLAAASCFDCLSKGLRHSQTLPHSYSVHSRSSNLDRRPCSSVTRSPSDRCCSLYRCDCGSGINVSPSSSELAETLRTGFLLVLVSFLCCHSGLVPSAVCVLRTTTMQVAEIPRLWHLPKLCSESPVLFHLWFCSWSCFSPPWVLINRCRCRHLLEVSCFFCFAGTPAVPAVTAWDAPGC